MRRLAATALALTVAALTWALTATPAGAALVYVNEMPVTGGVLRCYRDNALTGGFRNYQCNLHQTGTGTLIRNDLNIWAHDTSCDTLSMVFNGSGADHVDIRNGVWSEPTPPGEAGPRGCGAGTRGSGTQGMSQISMVGCCTPVVTNLHGGQFLHSSVSGGSSVCVGAYWPHNCFGPQEWHYRATWT